MPNESATNTDFETDGAAIKVKLCNLPPLNSIASQVLALTADPDVELNQISKVIEGDPAFAADILFLRIRPCLGSHPGCMSSDTRSVCWG